jgi:hypothetical protein
MFQLITTIKREREEEFADCLKTVDTDAFYEENHIPFPTIQDRLEREQKRSLIVSFPNAYFPDVERAWQQWYRDGIVGAYSHF